MQENHAPAAWHVGGDGTIVYDAAGMPVANATVYHARSEPDSARRNAVLIAAAPDLARLLSELTDAPAEKRAALCTKARSLLGQIAITGSSVFSGGPK